MKTTLLIDPESLIIKDTHFTTKNSYDGHIGLQVFRRNAEDLQVFLDDKGYPWSELREECRENGTRPVIKLHVQTSPSDRYRFWFLTSGSSDLNLIEQVWKSLMWEASPLMVGTSQPV